jgi:hypothetical protein
MIFCHPKTQLLTFFAFLIKKKKKYTPTHLPGFVIYKLKKKKKKKKRKKKKKKNKKSIVVSGVAKYHFSKGLCYYCDEKCHPSHKCKVPKSYIIKGMDFSKEERQEDYMEVGKDCMGGFVSVKGVVEELLIKKKGVVEELGEFLEISLHAITSS